MFIISLFSLWQMLMSVFWLSVCCACIPCTCFSLFEDQGFSLDFVWGTKRWGRSGAATKTLQCSINVYLFDWLLVIDLEFRLRIKLTCLNVFNKTKNSIDVVMQQCNLGTRRKQYWHEKTQALTSLCFLSVCRQVSQSSDGCHAHFNGSFLGIQSSMRQWV